MPYDEEGNFIYPLPPARKGRPSSSRRPKVPITSTPPGSKPVISSFQPQTFSPPPVAPESRPLTPIPSPPPPEPQPLPLESPPLPLITLPVSAGQSVFTVNEGGKRWDMSENDLALIWNAQNWPSGLKLSTTDGRAVEVVYRGRWSGGFGPDFKGASIRVGTELLKGDVELHLRSADWRLHGHHQDERYNGVVLQVTLEDSGAVCQTVAGANLPMLALLPLYRRIDAKLADSLAAARASGTRLGSLSESTGPCCDRVAEHHPDLAALLVRIDELGEKRFEERASKFEAACAADPDSDEIGAAQELWAGLLEALGYSQNKAPFRQLAATLPLSQVVTLDCEARRRGESVEERVITLEAALLGTAGLLPAQRRLKPRAVRVAEGESWDEPLEDLGIGRYTDELEGRWGWLERHLKATTPAEWQPLRERDWTFARLRPPNHPSRRIAGLARLLVRLKLDEAGDLLTLLSEKVTQPPIEACKELAGLFRVALEAAENDSAAFWSRRYDFSDRAVLLGENAKGASVDLIGADRAADIIVNIILPFLVGYGRDRHQPKVEKAALEAYRVHPRLGMNELVENVGRQVFRHWLENPAEAAPYFPVKNGGKLSLTRLLEGARRQQGLIYLHHHFCAEQNFGVCPLA
jgi:hypothetical protein